MKERGGILPLFLPSRVQHSRKWLDILGIVKLCGGWFVDHGRGLGKKAGFGSGPLNAR